MYQTTKNEAGYRNRQKPFKKPGRLLQTNKRNANVWQRNRQRDLQYNRVIMQYAHVKVISSDYINNCLFHTPNSPLVYAYEPKLNK